MRTDVLNARTTKAPYERKAFSKERERKEPQRKSLGFHIQLGFTAIALSSAFRGHMTSLSLSLYEDLKSALQRHRRERIEAFSSVFYFPCLLFPAFVLYSNRQRRSLYREKRICCVGEKPSSIVSRGALCVLSSWCFSRVSLSFSACVYISRAWCSW